MAIDLLLGLQWGDEGKGKIVDVLTKKYDIIARFQGGPNAGKAKYALWDLVDKGVFDGLNRKGNPITKTFKGSTENLFVSVIPPILLEPNLN